LKVAFICKRQYMSKDVILDKYARLYEIPNQLSLLGHVVTCYCLSYQNHDDGFWDESNDEKQIKWHSNSYKYLKKIKIFEYPFALLKKLKSEKPEMIIAASDIPHIIMGAWLAKKLNIPFVADLYDNFESYGQARIPLFRRFFHKALDTAQLITTTSYSLADKIKIEHPSVAHIVPMPSVINKSLFKVGNQSYARQELNLPQDAKLIGTAGGLTKMKGIHDLLNAWEIIRTKREDIYLVLAGPTEIATPLPNDDRVIYLGLLAHEKIPTLFQALDVGVLCIPDDEFGQYCFPQKAYEMLATDLAIVSTAIGDMLPLIGEHKALLYSAGNYEELAEALLIQISVEYKLNVRIPDWQETIKMMNHYLNQ
jgi:teichuronic acid biosynthesis glycosyltransferase TuaC